MAGTFDVPNSFSSVANVGHTSNFPQTGSWSMVDLLSKPLNVTVGVLQRYSAGRVDLYTSVVGQAMCTNFRLGAVGRKRLDAALSSLTAIGSLGNVLYFGFGIEDLVRSLAKTEEGAVCLALCAALRECYHEDVAVEVLLELARLTSVPGQYMPSSFEWKGLLNACSGALAITTFPLTAEQFMSLSGSDDRLGAFNALDASPSVLRSCSSPKTISQALFAMGRVTREELKAITIVGGADAGWLAALGQWLFDCKIKVALSDGTVMYKNAEEDGHIQLEFIFQGVEANAGTPSIPIQDLKIRNKIYVLDDASELFREEGRYVDAHVVSGRVKWDEALSITFMVDFRKLMQMSQTLGKLIGSAARIFQAISNSDESISLKYRAACASYCAESYGAGFIQSTQTWFPELRKLKTHMEKAAATTFTAAQIAYEAGIQNLRTSCQCATCQSADTFLDENASDDDEDVDMDSNDEIDWDPDKFCLVVMAETIICVSRSLAHMDVAKGLYPVRSGFEIAYGRQLTLRRSAHLGRSAIEEMGQIVFCLDFDNSFSWKMEEDLAEVRLFHALELFTGRSPSRRTWGVSAQCVNGICAFLGILKDVSVTSDAVGRIYVMPGRIDLESKSYSVLEDERLIEPRKNVFDSVLAQKSSTESNLLIKLRVKETSNSLQCLLEVPRAQDEGMVLPLLAGPAKLASMLASTRGWVACKKNGKCKKVIGDTLDNLLEEMKHGEIYLSAVNAQSNRQAIAALAAASTLEENCSLYLVEKQCHHCCARAAIQIDRPEERNRFCFVKYRL